MYWSLESVEQFFNSLCQAAAATSAATAAAATATAAATAAAAVTQTCSQRYTRWQQSQSDSWRHHEYSSKEKHQLQLVTTTVKGAGGSALPPSWGCAQHRA
jgi:hypothetical protein